jgi:hypothetical protein
MHPGVNQSFGSTADLSDWEPRGGRFDLRQRSLNASSVMKLWRPLRRPSEIRTLAVVETSSFEGMPRGWLLPRSVIVELGFAFTRLAIVGLIAIGISGVIAGIFGSAFGRSFVAGDLPGVTYTAARCADYFEYSPGAKTCEEAATWHHYGEVFQYRLAAGVLGLLILGAYVLAQRKLRHDPAALPSGFVPTIGTTMYGAAAFYLLATSVNGALLHETAGVGGMLSGGVVAAVMAVVYGIALYRILLRRAEHRLSPHQVD